MTTPRSDGNELDSVDDLIDEQFDTSRGGSLTPAHADDDSEGGIQMGTLLAQTATRSSARLSFRDGFCLPFRSLRFMIETRLCVILCPEFWIASVFVGGLTLYGAGLTFYALMIRILGADTIGNIHALRLNYIVFGVFLFLVLLYSIFGAGYWQRLSLSTENVLLKAEIGTILPRCGIRCCCFVSLGGIVAVFENVVVGVVSALIALAFGLVPVAFAVFLFFKLLLVAPFAFRVISLSRRKSFGLVLRWILKNPQTALGFWAGTLVLECIPFMALVAPVCAVVAATRIFVENIEEK